MQRVNQAYDKNNLLQLLELQLELEHIDQSAIDNISEDRLKHYNKILKDQLAELEQEIVHVEGGFRAQFGISPFVEVSPARSCGILPAISLASSTPTEILRKTCSWLMTSKQLRPGSRPYSVGPER